MSSIFTFDSSTTVAVFCQETDVYESISTILGSLKISVRQHFRSCDEALIGLSKESFQWIATITTIESASEQIEILKAILASDGYKRPLCSFFAKENLKNDQELALCFEKGLLSYHFCNFDAESLEDEIKDLLTIIRANGNDAVLTSSSYLRKFLKDKKQKDRWLDLERELLTLYKGRELNLLSYGEAQFEVGQIANAKETFRKLRIINPHLASTCEKIEEKYAHSSEESATDIDTEKLNALGIEHVVIIDPDEQYASYLKAQLLDVGISNVERFLDGQEAWHHLENNSTGLYILTEWKIGRLSALQLIQRIRLYGNFGSRIIVMSSLLRQSDLLLLTELGIDAILEKPFGLPKLFKTIIWTLQSIGPIEKKPLELQIRRLLKKSDLENAQRLIALYVSNPRIERYDKLLICSEWEFSLGNASKAVEIAMAAAQLGRKDHYLLNHIGKCLLEAGLPDKAVQLFERAHSLCPENIERILNLSNAYEEIHRLDKAAELLEQAKQIDAGNKLVRKRECELAIQTGNVSDAAQYLTSNDNISGIISSMNTKAIGLSRTGRFDESFDLYKHTLAAIPPNDSDNRNAVSYNLALAYARNNRLHDAEDALINIKAPKKRIAAKTESLLKKILLCKEKHQPFVSELETKHETSKKDDSSTLNYGTWEHSVQKQSHPIHLKDTIDRIFSAVTVAKGDLCCFLIYRADQNK